MTNKTTSAIDLVERLRKVELHRRDLANADGDYWDRVPRNPDGPEAADTITRLQAALDQAKFDLQLIGMSLQNGADGREAVPAICATIKRISSVGGE